MPVLIKLATGLCALGALVLLASLFMPWYGPGEAVDYLTLFGSSQAVDFFSGRYKPDGWQALSVIDIYLAALSVLTILVSILAQRRGVRRAFALTAAGALVAVGLIVYRLVEPVVPFDVPSILLGTDQSPFRIDFLIDPRVGVYVALGGAVSILVGSTALFYGSESPIKSNRRTSISLAGPGR
jgi:hypothetical protein